MINVNQITAQLAKMPDPALQKYAAMNKNDPYIVALAVAESNRRKQLRQAAQGAQGMQEAPKVVDQALQGMAAPMPEDVGIARLPAGDMNFADGGIVAFADGGDVERYNGEFGSLTGEVQRVLQKSPLERTPEDNALLAQAGYSLQSRTMPQDSGLAGVNRFLSNIGPNIRNYFTAGASRLSDEELAQQPNVGGAQNERILRRLGLTQSTTPLEPQASYSNEGRRQPGLFAEAAPAAAPVVTGQRPPATGTQGAPGAGTTPGAGTAPGAGTGSAALQALFDKMQEANKPALKEIRDARKELGEQMIAVPKKNLEDFDAEQAKRGDVFKGREERLRQREGEFGKMKDTSAGLALLQAGAAIMSTRGSLATALGKGINVGAERYAAGLDKLNAAKERLFDAKDRLEELRVNRDDLTAKERRSLQTAANNAVLDAKKLGLEGLTQELGYKREDAGKLLTGMTSILGAEIGAAATIQAAKIRSQDQKEYLEVLRGGDMVEKARKNIMDAIIKANPHADEPTRQALFTAEWTKALKNNPALAKYAGGAPGGGGPSSADPLGLR